MISCIWKYSLTNSCLSFPRYCHLDLLTYDNKFGIRDTFYKAFEGELWIMFQLAFALQFFSQKGFSLKDFIKIVRSLLATASINELLDLVTKQYFGKYHTKKVVPVKIILTH